jgi:hypothetical protein
MKLPYKYFVNLHTRCVLSKEDKWLYLGEPHAGKNKQNLKATSVSSGTRKRRCPGAPRKKKRSKISRHTDYRMAADWNEDSCHPTETEILPHVDLFVKKHRRMPRLEEINEMMSALHVDEVEPHDGDEEEDEHSISEEWTMLQSAFLRFMKEFKNKQFASERVISFVEDMFATLWLIPRMKTGPDLVFLMMMFVKNVCQPTYSFTTMLRNFLCENLLDEPLVDESDSDDNHDGYEAQGGWEMVNLLQSWRQGINHPLFAKAAFLLSFLVTAGFVKERMFTLGSFELFKAEAFNANTKFGDIVDGLLSTIIFFLEKGYQCFEQGSLGPLWGATSELHEFDDQVAFLVANIANVRNGNLEERTQISDNKYEDMLDKCREKVKMLIDAAPNTTLRAMMLQNA